MPLRVVVLSYHSLFACGVASRLGERPDLFDVLTIDVGLADAPDRLCAAHPAIVVIDTIDTGVTQKIPLVELFEILPGIKVVQLDYSSDQVRIISSEQRRARKTGELMAIMQDISPAPEHASIS